jgi:hypothetical protein
VIHPFSVRLLPFVPVRLAFGFADDAGGLTAVTATGLYVTYDRDRSLAGVDGVRIE